MSNYDYTVEELDSIYDRVDSFFEPVNTYCICGDEMHCVEQLSSGKCVFICPSCGQKYVD